LTGKDKLDTFFKRMPVPEITATKIQEYIKWRRKEGERRPHDSAPAGAPIFSIQPAKELDKLTDNHIPSFVLPDDSKPRKGFLDIEGFQKLHDALPSHWQTTVKFLYFTGCRFGAEKDRLVR